MSNSRKNFLIITAVIILIISLVLLYFLVWRPSDASYKSANDSLSVMSSSSISIDENLTTVRTANDITDSFVAKLESDADKFNTALKSLQDNTLVTKDQSVKATYAQYGNMLATYGKAVDALKASMQRYGTIIAGCTYLVGKLPEIKSTGTFDSIAIGCTTGLSNTASLASTPFRDQYLDEYTSLTTDLVNTYRTAVLHLTAKELAADNATTSAILQKISTLAQKELNLSSTDPTSSIQKIQDVVTAQSKAFFR